ncbi:MAG: phage tail sheath protein [Candidatus Accumulibacter meliphilus]|jgi:hypothetical protein|uniref:Phage tail sheath protein n=1 Tax=Candidatus Accumulibacter meliphilus TaxID=2211374 RepID=A0A369XRZ6_9PROT|nr:MAG: phage tail sheath protein [Candidatus Accumulibacter meliphilus]
MARIIPGVQVTVVKEVVPPQLAPSGVLGLIGITEKDAPPNSTTMRTSSWGRFLEVCGAATAYSMPEARQALANGAFELVIVPLKSSTTAKAAAVDLATEDTAKLKIEARAAGVWANGFRLKVSHRVEADGRFDLEISSAVGDPVEVHRNLEPATVAEVLSKGSAVVRVAGTTLPPRRPIVTDPVAALAGGKDASADDYIKALEHLKSQADVDMVLAAVQDFSKVTSIYSAVIAHCNGMSTDSNGRIGFGQVSPNATETDAKTMASTLQSDRFVLLAPHGVVGAVAGRIGGLQYFESPTFKTISGIDGLSRALPLEEQSGLLSAFVVPVVEQRGRGVIVLRGITTDGDQISVRRIADRAVRGVKTIGELFIGRLNSEDGRGALKQKLIEFLVQMERESALVPSADGKEPPFSVDVSSLAPDFAAGIVRVDIAVRPVRAIDYIYATIVVQV